MNQATKISLFDVILAVIAGGVWYAQRPTPETPPPADNGGQAVDDSGGSVADEGTQNGGVDTDDWITYNHLHYYGYKIPNDWEENITPGEVYFFNTEDRNQSIQISHPSLAEEMLEGYPESQYRKSKYIDLEQPIVIDGQKAYKFITKDGDITSVSSVVRYQRNDKEYVFEIITSGFTNADKFFDAFVKNFKILKDY